ncbi:MAG: repressor LexA [Anaerolineae bacterium]|nr:repressor LexA [Anaerolineae bacterium]
MRERNKISEKQRNILRFMETFIDQKGYPPTIRQIGEAVGIDSTSVVNYNLNKLVQAGYLERTGRTSRGIRLIKPLNPRRVSVNSAYNTPRIPLIGQIVASAPVSIPEDMGHHIDDDNLIEVPVSFLNGIDPSEVFALKVKGDSMIDAMISDGDIVLLRRQDTVSDGQMVAVWLDERGETTLKHFFAEGPRVRLQPAHPTMSPIYVDAAHCHIQGRVLSVLRPSV